MMLKWTVPPGKSGIKLLAFIFEQLKGKYSSKFIKRLIESNGCEINGRTERFASTCIGEGDHVSFQLKEEGASTPRSAEAGRILFEDESLLIYNKPAGIVCDEKGILQFWKSSSPSLKLIHRLDRDTTGALLLAKEKAVFDDLVNQFKQFRVEKRYLAVVDGFIEPQKGKIENYLIKKQSYAGQAIWGAGPRSHGLYAFTEWETLGRGKNASFIACSPRTGRTHQIRVHLAELGHPILGDFQYAKEFQCVYRPPRILLHAESIRFRHPVTGEAMEIAAPLPEEFKTSLKEIACVF